MGMVFTLGITFVEESAIWEFVSSRMEICCCSRSNCDSAMEAFGL
jgi:hypothetical protein